MKTQHSNFSHSFSGLSWGQSSLLQAPFQGGGCLSSSRAHLGILFCSHSKLGHRKSLGVCVVPICLLTMNALSVSRACCPPGPVHSGILAHLSSALRSHKPIYVGLLASQECNQGTWFRLLISGTVDICLALLPSPPIDYPQCSSVEHGLVLVFSAIGKLCSYKNVLS